MKLLVQALVKLFVLAGTLHFGGAWRMMVTLFGPMIILGSYLFLGIKSC